MKQLLVLLTVLVIPSLAAGQVQQAERIAGHVKEDTAHATGDAGVQMLIRRDDSPSSNCDDGDYCTPVMSSSGAIYMQQRRDLQVADSLGLLKAEDAAHATGDAGVAVLGVANEYSGTTFGANGDYTPIGTTLKGAVRVLVDENNQEQASTGLLKQEDAPHANADRGVVALGVRTDSPATRAGADGDNSVLQTDANGALWVTNQGQTVTVDVALTIDTAAYAAGDYINDADDITDLAGSLRAGVLSGEIREVVITDEGKEGKNLEVWFFDTDPTSSTFTDNAAFTVNDADLVNVCCVVSVTSHYAAADNGVSIGRPTNCECVSAGTTLYAAIVAREAVTYDATDAMTIRVTIDQD